MAPHHFSDVAKAVQEMARVASGGGGVAVIDLEGDEDQALDDLNHEIEVLHDPTHPPHSVTGWKPVLNRRISFSPPASASRRSGLAGSSSRGEQKWPMSVGTLSRNNQRTLKRTLREQKMSRFRLCRVGLTSQQNQAFYLWFAVVFSPIPTPASNSCRLCGRELE
jgi:hypothetical protein